MVDSGTNYGGALFYYARARNQQKLKEVIHTLITLSVIQSAAYPAEKDLDDTLQKLLKSPLKAVRLLKSNDADAPRYLSMYLSGYATIRKVYESRDEDVGEEADGQDEHLYRRQRAAAPLIAAIVSAADSIRGGQVNPEAELVVPVDNLLVLLGEALAFINRMYLHGILRNCNLLTKQ